MGMVRKCPKSDAFVICNGDCLHCERTSYGHKVFSLICREDLIEDIKGILVYSGESDGNESCVAVKVLERIWAAPAVTNRCPSGCKYCLGNALESAGLDESGVYLSMGSSRPPEHEKFRFCPNCGRKL